MSNIEKNFNIIQFYLDGVDAAMLHSAIKYINRFLVGMYP